VNEDGDNVREVFDMFIPMYIACLDVLSEHNLVKAKNTPAFNISPITLILLEFLEKTACDFDMEHNEEIVRAADLAGVDLVMRDGIEISEDDIKLWRSKYEKNYSKIEAGEIKTDEVAWRQRWDWKTMVTTYQISLVFKRLTLHPIVQVLQRQA
jgi:hypothetical protein